MSAGPRMLLPVELVGGPLDGERREVEMQEPGFDVYLFRRCEGGRNDVMAYRYTGRSLACGKRWALDFLYYVARKLDEKGGRP